MENMEIKHEELDDMGIIVQEIKKLKKNVENSPQKKKIPEKKEKKVSYKSVGINGGIILEGGVLSNENERRGNELKRIQKILAEGKYTLIEGIGGDKAKTTQGKKGTKLQGYGITGGEREHLKIIVDGHEYDYYSDNSKENGKTKIYGSFNNDVSGVLVSKSKCYAEGIITNKYTYTKEDIAEIDKEYINDNYIFSHKEGNVYVYTYIVQGAPGKYIQNGEEVKNILNEQIFEKQEFFTMAGKPLTKAMSMPKGSKILIKITFSK